MAQIEPLLAVEPRRRRSTGASSQAYALRHRRWDDTAARYVDLFSSLIG